FIPPEAFPFKTPTGATYDSGNYEQALDKALQMVEYKALREEQRRLRGQGRYLGIGLSSYVEITGLGAAAALPGGLWESATVRVSPQRAVEVKDVARAAYKGTKLPPGTEPGLEVTHFFAPPERVFPFGTHVCVVEVDPQTGEVMIRRYVAVDDCGTILNPLLVAGQVHGGIAQGLAQALYEEAVYDESGTVLTAGLPDYAVPKAAQLPAFDLGHTVTPSPHNPLGAKGVGEAGTIGATPAVVNAVLDALTPF